MTKPHDRSALHLDLLAQRLGEATPPDDLGNIIGAAVHPTDLRSLRTWSERDDEIVTFLHNVRRGVDRLGDHVPDYAADALGDCVERLARSAVAYMLAGDVHLAREQWAVAGQLLGFGKSKTVVDVSAGVAPADVPLGDRHAEVAAVASVFAKAGLSARVTRDGATGELRPVVVGSPTPKQIWAIVRHAHADLARDIIGRTRGMQSLHVPLDDGDHDTFTLQFSVEGEESLP